MPFGSSPFGSVPFGGREAVTVGAASGAISGNTSVTFTPTAALSATAAISGSASAAFSATGNLTGGGSISGAATVSFSATAALSATVQISGTALAAFSATGNVTNGAAVVEETSNNKGRKSRLKFWRDLYVEKLAEAEREEKRQLADLAKEQAIIERQKKQQAERERARLVAIEAERFKIETAQAERRAAVLAEALGEIERRNEQARLADEIAALNAQITATERAMVELAERCRQWEHHQRLLEEDFIMLMAA